MKAIAKTALKAIAKTALKAIAKTALKAIAKTALKAIAKTALKVALREKAITLNSTADLYPEVLLWIGLAQGKLWS